LALDLNAEAATGHEKTALLAQRRQEFVAQNAVPNAGRKTARSLFARFWKSPQVSVKLS
jgi:hypothetical protein